MKTFTDMAADIQRLKKDIVKAANQATEDTAKGAVQTARYFSGGMFSSAALAGMGHPYRTGQGPSNWFKGQAAIPYGDPGIINKQSGTFQADWIYTNLKLSSGIVIRVVKNTAPYAQYLQTGTRRMIARPIDKHIKDYIDRSLPLFLAKRIDPVIRAFCSG